MVFIRTKRFSSQLYGYVVENTWTPRGPRQKVTQYLGKITLQPPVTARPFPNVDIGRLSYPDALRAVLIWNLLQIEFKAQQGSSAHLYEWNKITADTLLFTLKHADGKDAIIKRDEGYLCTIGFQHLVNFTMEENEEKTGYAFARAFVDAGLDVPRDVFVRIFEKIWRDI